MDDVLYKKKVLGGWLGKAIGGTLGQPYEGCDGPLALTFYDPVPTDMLPNDDIELQVLWACRLAAMERPVVSYAVFEESWLNSIDCPCDEYGIAIRNLRRGIPAPWSGRFDNYFVDGLGAAIRSELWASLAPGDPQKAVRFATFDGAVDHDGNGLYAIRFLAALESMAFVENDMRVLIDHGLAAIPADSELAHAVRETVRWASGGMKFRELRERILDAFESDNFTDVKMNFAFMIAALLLAKGDFGTAVCTAVNFGRDTDCTGATVGAIMGIVDPDGIPQEYLKPIGSALVISGCIKDINPPATLDGLSDLVGELRKRVVASTGPEPAMPDFAKFEIQWRTSLFKPWFGQDDQKFRPVIADHAETFTAPGHFVRLDPATIPTDALRLYETGFHIAEARECRIMVNANANCRVWIDGRYCFGREGGRMSPSFHRAPLNQYCDLLLAPGNHTLMIGLAPLNRERPIEMVWGVADRKTLQWL